MCSQSDFLATIDLNKTSPTYRKIIHIEPIGENGHVQTTADKWLRRQLCMFLKFDSKGMPLPLLPAGSTGNEPHHISTNFDGTRIVGSGLLSFIGSTQPLKHDFYQVITHEQCAKRSKRGSCPSAPFYCYYRRARDKGLPALGMCLCRTTVTTRSGPLLPCCFSSTSARIPARPSSSSQTLLSCRARATLWAALWPTTSLAWLTAPTLRLRFVASKAWEARTAVQATCLWAVQTTCCQISASRATGISRLAACNARPPPYPSCILPVLCPASVGLHPHSPAQMGGKTGAPAGSITIFDANLNSVGSWNLGPNADNSACESPWLSQLSTLHRGCRTRDRSSPPVTLSTCSMTMSALTAPSAGTSGCSRSSRR